MRSTRRHITWLPWLALTALLVLAAGLRLYQLGTLPAGLHFDEAANGMLALDVLAGKWPVYFSAYNGREAAYPYLVALAIKLLGQTILAVRLPAALAGALLVLAIFLVGRRMLGTGGALLAAGAAAGAPWLLHLNRIGFRSNLLPLTLTLWAWLLLRALETNRRRDWLAAGVVLGLTAHTYLASRFVPILVALFLGYLAVWHRPLLRRALPGVSLMLVVAALIALPLVIHFLRVPADWSERSGQVWACAGLETGPCLARIAEHAWATFGMVGIRGDPLRFFNLPGSPALPGSVGWLFYVGVALALRRWRQPGIALLLLWWLTMALPGILSRDSVTYVRTSGAAAPTMLLWALPLVVAGRALFTRYLRSAAVFASAGTAVVLLVAVLSAHEYFTVWARQPELYYDYMGYATDAARAANTVSPGYKLYISEEYYRHPTYLYLAPNTSNGHWIDARDGWPLVPPDYYSLFVLAATTPVDPQVQPFIASAQSYPALNQHGQYGYTLLELPPAASASPTPATALHATVGGLALEGTTMRHADDTLQVTFFWRVRDPARRDLRVFVHLVDSAANKIAQDDGLGYPAREWRTGERFVTFHTLALPAEQPLVDYRLAVGLYDVFTGERLATHGQEARGNVLLLPIRVE